MYRYFLSVLIAVIASFYTACETKYPAEHLTIHYHRYDHGYENWTLWTWLDDVQNEISASGKDRFGPVFKLDISKYPAMGNINFLPKYKNWERKDDPNRVWIRTMPAEVWIIEGEPTVFTSQPPTGPAIRKAFLDAPDKITLVLTHKLKKSELQAMKPVIFLADGRQLHAGKVTLTNTGKNMPPVIAIDLDNNLGPEMLPARVEVNGFRSAQLQLRYIFDDKKYYSDNPLGLQYTPNQTKFSVYSPGAKRVWLNIYDKPHGGKEEKYELQPEAAGIWSVSIEGDLKNLFYTYRVEGGDPGLMTGREVIDPYARAVTRHDGRGIIINDKTHVTESPVFPFKNAVIYEMHVRDFSISEDSGIEHKGKFLGFTETGTTLPGSHLATGIDHLVELGINTVQLMPVQDFEFDADVSEYFWGYMPVNFNAPEGWFATRRDDDTPVREFKMLVDALHKKGIKVVMDVVYNHTSEGNPLVRYNFNGLAPNFYYRQREDGSYWNGSGCGNEMRSENPMVRRFIVESLKYWVEEYKVDGFRFDLMGLHDIETMRLIVKSLKAIKPDIFIYGEPWTAGDTPIEPTVKGKQRGEDFSVFNDHFRDAIKGPWYDNSKPGYIQSGINLKEIKKGVMGSIDDFAESAHEAINYVAVHDGRTLWDLLKVSTDKDSTITEKQLIAMDKLAAAIVFTSQGVPFIHGGQEMLRTKLGSHNSYNQPDKINKIRWQWKKEHYDVFNYYRGLITLRKAHPIFRLTSANEIRKNLTFLDQKKFRVPDKCIAYHLTKGASGDSWNEVCVLINSNRRAKQFRIPAGEWNIVLNEKHAGIKNIGNIAGDRIKVQPVSMLLIWR